MSSDLEITVHFYEAVDPLSSYSNSLRPLTALPFRFSSGRDLLSYSHDIKAVGGFDAAEIELGISMSDAAEWINYGLGRHVFATGIGGATVWEGFVNEISVSVGGVNVSVGPLMGVSNKVKVKYQEISWDIPDTPVRGLPGETAFAEDTASQDQFFVLEEILNIGEASEESLGQATDVRDTYLNEMAWPRTTQDISVGKSEEVSITVSCLGYYHLLRRFYYSNTGATESIDASQKIIDVFTADPNGIVDSVVNIESNTSPVSDHEEGDSTGWDVILDTISYGTSNSYRYIVGLEDGFAAYAREITPFPDFLSMQYEITAVSRRPSIRLLRGGGRVAPSMVRPGEWALVSDLPVGWSGFSHTLTDGVNTYFVDPFDPRLMFIESVGYSLDGDLSLTGGVVDTVDRVIARIGLEGLYR